MTDIYGNGSHRKMNELVTKHLSRDAFAKYGPLIYSLQSFDMRPNAQPLSIKIQNRLSGEIDITVKERLAKQIAENINELSELNVAPNKLYTKNDIFDSLRTQLEADILKLKRTKELEDKERTTLLRTLVDTNVQFSDAKAEIQNLTREKEKLQENIFNKEEELASEKKKTQKLQDELDAFYLSVSTSETFQTKQQERSAKAMEMNKQRERFAKAMETQVNQNSELRTQVETLKTQLKKVETLEQEVNSLKDQIRQCEQNIASEKERSAKLEITRDKLRQDIAAKDSSIEALKQENLNLQRQVDNCQKVKNDLVTENTSLKEQVRTNLSQKAEEQIQNLQIQRKELESANLSLNEEHQKNFNKIISLESQIQRQNDEIQSLQDRLPKEDLQNPSITQEKVEEIQAGFLKDKNDINEILGKQSEIEKVDQETQDKIQELISQLKQHREHLDNLLSVENDKNFVARSSQEIQDMKKLRKEIAQTMEEAMRFVSNRNSTDQVSRKLNFEGNESESTSTTTTTTTSESHTTSIVGTSEKTKFLFSAPARHRDYYDDNECARVVETLTSARILCDEIERLTNKLPREQLKSKIPMIGPLALEFKVGYHNEIPFFNGLDETVGVQSTEGVFEMAIRAGIDMIQAYGLKDISSVTVGTQHSRQSQYPHQDGPDAYLAFLYYYGNPTLTPTLIRKLNNPSLLINGWYESLPKFIGRKDRKQIEDNTQKIQILGFDTSCEKTLLIDNLRTVHETPKDPKGHIIRFSFQRAPSVPHPDIVASFTDKTQGSPKQFEVPTSASDWNKAALNETEENFLRQAQIDVKAFKTLTGKKLSNYISQMNSQMNPDRFRRALNQMDYKNFDGIPKLNLLRITVEMVHYKFNEKMKDIYNKVNAKIEELRDLEGDTSQLGASPFSQSQKKRLVFTPSDERVGNILGTPYLTPPQYESDLNKQNKNDPSSETVTQFFTPTNEEIENTDDTQSTPPNVQGGNTQAIMLSSTDTSPAGSIESSKSMVSIASSSSMSETDLSENEQFVQLEELIYKNPSQWMETIRKLISNSKQTANEYFLYLNRYAYFDGFLQLTDNQIGEVYQFIGDFSTDQLPYVYMNLFFTRFQKEVYNLLQTNEKEAIKFFMTEFMQFEKDQQISYFYYLEDEGVKILDKLDMEQIELLKKKFEDCNEYKKSFEETDEAKDEVDLKKKHNTLWKKILSIRFDRFVKLSDEDKQKYDITLWRKWARQYEILDPSKKSKEELLKEIKAKIASSNTPRQTRRTNAGGRYSKSVGVY